MKPVEPQPLESQPLKDVVDIQPGHTVEMKCPSGTFPDLVAGDSVQVEGKDLAYVVSVEAETVRLGPLLAGEHSLQISCKGGEPVVQNIRVTPLEPNKLPEREMPLVPESFAYPIWIWVVLLVLLTLLTGFIVWLFSRNRSKLPARKVQEQVKIDPERELVDFVKMLPRMKFVDTQDSRELLQLYLSIYEKLRAFLDMKFNLKASIDTTREFLVSFRAAGLKFEVPAALMSHVESLLLKCDDVRFSGEIPNMHVRKQNLQALEAIVDSMKSQNAGVETS